MQPSNILLLTLINFALIFTAKSVENDTKSISSNEPHLFLAGYPQPLMSIDGFNASTVTLINTPRRHPIMALDYHAPTKTLFYTSPRAGHWMTNSKLYSIPWDAEIGCDKRIEPGDPYCTVVPVEGAGINNTINFYDRQKDGKMLREEENWNPRSLAVDNIGNKLYVVDTGERSVNVLDLDGQNKTLVFQNDSLIPLEVVLDPIQGLMFVLAANIKIGSLQIYRANMDGSFAQLIVNNTYTLGDFFVREKTGFALDAFKKRLYFSNFDKKIIESVDYEGNNRVQVAKAKYPISISIYNNTLYWTNANVSAITLFVCINVECNVWTCELNDIDGVCTDGNAESSLIEEKYLVMHFIKAVSARPQSANRVSNPCSIDNGGCQHHCLLRHSTIEGSLAQGCVCQEGYRLTQNLKSCSRVKVTKIYDDFYVPSNLSFTSLGKPAGDNFFPMSRNLLYRLTYESSGRILYQPPFRVLEVSKNGRNILDQSLKPKDVVTSSPDMDFMITFMVGFAHPFQHICRKSSEDSQYLIHHQNGIARALAYDWISKNLYYVKLPNKSDEQAELMVLRYDRPERLCTDKEENIKFVNIVVTSLAEIHEPVSLAMHPYRGYVFVSLRNGSLLRLNSNGSSKLTIPNVNNSVLLAVDLSEDKLYWLDSDRYVNYVNLDGSDPKRLFRSLEEEPESMHIFGDWIYVKNKKGDRLWRFNKVSGEDSVTLDVDIENLYCESVGMKVLARDAQYVNTGDNPCAVNNGGCEHFCFAVPAEEIANELRSVCANGTSQKVLEDEIYDEYYSHSEDRPWR